MPSSKDLYQRWIDEVWNKGDVDRLDDLHTADFVDRTGLPGVPPDTNGMKMFVAGLRAGFPDAVFVIDDVVAEADRVAGRWTMRGTNSADFNGIPATGGLIELTGFDMLRIEGDKFAELWHLEDNVSMLQQLGVIPVPPT